MRRTIFAALSLLLVGAWSQPAQAQVPDELADIIPGWAEAFNAGNAAAVAAHYTEDAIRMAPEGDMQEGREAIAAATSEFAGVSIKLKAAGGLLEGDHASQWGMFELNWTGENGEPLAVSGRWMNALKKTSEGWKIYRDIWNYGPTGIGPNDL